MSWLLDPFSASFMLHALVGGLLVAGICGVAGTWVVIRGSAFLGEALAHGMVPGVALAALLGFPSILGAAVSAGAMATGVGLLTRNRRLSDDTAIALLFVGMLALGVLIVSRSRSFATDLTAVLFGDVLAIRGGDLVQLAVAVLLTVALAAGFHRSFVALAFDPAKAATLGLRPHVGRIAVTVLVTLAVVSSYQAVGSLLVVGLLVGPAAAARPWTSGIAASMAVAAGIGAVAVVAGLLLSWHAGTAAGASIAVLAVASYPLSVLLRAARRTRPVTAAPAVPPAADSTPLLRR
ncbi:zinc/manganese transport system permease protein/manganese/iron transport system permease protein [Nakamurella flavida]|uniref:zinc ABC transporter permease AztB n=1 Tax=Nakamurella flavida TaxID=363630 RepID=UPI0027851B81|nr:zinc ABC transporter permease AztB [Nakamurella flavida]MDP9778516.1 zinc/manganese transport system permease protein/manganese/iron transport system permease protein [Nakamurella flavida]